ncbi:hypothetical protein DL764_008118 [Monosporascus ibericus]|uniref:Chromo domain-containing protein n=1 Tax=Monosporascus ibericus TaxID=155417 RepID=A0A4Q4SYC3_9PEZI|nr:hypothetical protein DL764_008118 [Monosporascus ibericus]
MADEVPLPQRALSYEASIPPQGTPLPPYYPIQKLEFDNYGPIPTDAEDSDDNDHDDRPLYEVEEITPMRLRGRTTELFVKWKGWDLEEGEWKALKELRGCKRLVRKLAGTQKHVSVGLSHAAWKQCIRAIHRWLDKEDGRQALSWRRCKLNAEQCKLAAMRAAISAIGQGDNPEYILRRYSERVKPSDAEERREKWVCRVVERLKQQVFAMDIGQQGN